MLCRRLINLQRHLARQLSVSSSVASLVKQIPTYSNIKVASNFHLIIRPYDVVDCPDSNLCRITLQPRDVTAEPSPKIAKAIANFKPTIQIDDQNIAVDTQDASSHQELSTDELNSLIYCLIEVPVQANLKVTGQRDVRIERMHCDDITVSTSEGSIATNAVHAANLSLVAQNGAIHCGGSTLSQKMDLRTFGDKPIHVQNVLGDSLTAITENGTISTEACYAEQSKFVTQKGGLQLSNVHKSAELVSLDGGDVNVTGFHGQLQARTAGGTLQFQLTEVSGDSFIVARTPNAFVLNISEFVEQHTCLSIDAAHIALDSNLSESGLRRSNANGRNRLESGNRDIMPDCLRIETDGDIKLGKLSWLEAMQLKFAAVGNDAAR